MIRTLFPEGTGGDGDRFLAFESALMSVAEWMPEGEALTGQPAPISSTKLGGPHSRARVEAVLRLIRGYGLGAAFVATGGLGES